MTESHPISSTQSPTELEWCHYSDMPSPLAYMSKDKTNREIDNIDIDIDKED